MTIDSVNAMFEIVGSVIIWANYHQLKRDRKINGVYWPVTAFYVAWGLWSAYYYYALGHWWSFAGQLMMIAANTSWLVLAVRILYFSGVENERT